MGLITFYQFFRSSNYIFTSNDQYYLQCRPNNRSRPNQPRFDFLFFDVLLLQGLAYFVTIALPTPDFRHQTLSSPSPKFFSTATTN